MANDDVRIRIARPDDAEAIQEIYAPYVTDTAVTFAYEVPTVEDFRKQITEIEEKYPWLVATIDHKVVGYAYANQFKAREAYNWAVEMSIYLNQDTKRQGIGTKLYYALEEFLREMGYRNCNACIAVSPRRYRNNEDIFKNESTRFHRRVGYNLVGRFHKVGYKFGKWYDMVWMEKKIADHVDDPAPVVPFAEWRKEKDI